MRGNDGRFERSLVYGHGEFDLEGTTQSLGNPIRYGDLCWPVATVKNISQNKRHMEDLKFVKIGNYSLFPQMVQ